MKKVDITADKLGITREIRKVREVLVLPRGGLATTRVKERAVSLACIPALHRPLPGDEER